MIHATYTGTVTAPSGGPDYRARAQFLNAPTDYEATVDNAAAQAILAQPRLALAAPGDTVPRVVGRVRWLHDAAGSIPLAYSSPLLDIGRTISVDLPDWGYSAELGIVEEIQTVVGDGTVVDSLTVRFGIF